MPSKHLGVYLILLKTQLLFGPDDTFPNPKMDKVMLVAGGKFWLSQGQEELQPALQKQSHSQARSQSITCPSTSEQLSYNEASLGAWRLAKHYIHIILLSPHYYR